MTRNHKRAMLVGAAAAAAAGLVPGASLGGYAALFLAPRLTGAAAVPGTMTAAIIVCGALVGALAAAACGIVLGSMAGYLAAGAREGLRDLQRSWADERARRQRPLLVLPHAAMEQEVERTIRREVAFLDRLRASLHGLVVVGSAAHGARTEGSDIDVVVVARERAGTLVQEAVAEHALDRALRGAGIEMEYVVLRPSEVNELFRLGSPFAFALREGAVLWDDGSLPALRAERTLRAPGRKYALRALYETILVPYYGTYRALEREARSRGCMRSCCEANARCPGIGPADLAGRVLLRMLYVTLPARGCMPLTREDVITFAGRLYGDERSDLARHAAVMARTRAASIRYGDYLQLRRFAGELFREVLGTIGSSRDLRGMLADAAHLVLGRYGQVRDRRLRRCVARS